MKPVCPYCGKEARAVTGATIYPHAPHLHAKHFWYCQKDDAYVGCHRDSYVPLGRLANAELREMKKRAHQAFDPLWKRQIMGRSEAYAWLSKAMGIPAVHTHIGMFDEKQCQTCIDVCMAERTRRGVAQTVEEYAEE